MHEVRSHGPSPVQSAGLETPLSFEVRVEASEDVNETLRAWDSHIKKIARAVAWSIGGSLDDAEDFAQAARISLWRSIRDGLPSGEAYRKRVIPNAVVDAARRERSGFRSLSISRGDLDETQIGSHDDSLPLQVGDWVATLPHGLKNIYELLYVQGYTQREAAQRLRVTQPRIAQLHAELKRCAHEDFPETVSPSLFALPSGSGRAA
jgi:RNA polymerase sigma factor (sigma-70 family)